MRNLPTSHRVTYHISIWVESRDDEKPIWRGSFETGSGQSLDFSTMAELGRFLCELGGWVDPAERVDGMNKAE